MNTKFKILWFEDEIAWYRMEQRRINRILEEHYLIPEIARRDGADFAVEELQGNEYDLIIMDYKLAEGATGDTIVSAIRENDILTDILFYSSEEQNMLAALSKGMPPIDGVYLTKRDTNVFTEKAEKLISKIVRRSEDIVNLRGFVLDNTSDFELRLREILNICWQKFDEEYKCVLTDVVNKLLDGKTARTKSQVEKARKQKDVFAYVNNNDYLLGVADRLDVLQEVLPVLSSAYQMPEGAHQDDFKQYYIDRIGVYRNRLGHVRFGEKTIHVNGEEVEINQEFHRQLRKNIAEMDAAIGRIETYITEKM